MSAVVLRADARSLPLPDGSVDLIVTSPPYFGLRSYTDGGEHYEGQIGSEETPREWLAALLDCTREWMRVLKPSGSIFVNLGDKYSDRGHGPNRGNGTGRGPQAVHLPQTRGPMEKSLLGLPWRYALGCVDDLGLILRAEIVWAKPNSLPESVTDRVRRAHEQVFHFTRRPRYFSAVDEIREEHLMRPQRRPAGRPLDTTPRQGQPKQTWPTAQRDEVGVDGHPLGKLPGSVWEIPSQPLIVPDRLDIDHFAAFPMELPRRIILGWSPSGICTGCGEGRRPVSQVANVEDRKGRRQRIVDFALDAAHGPDGRGGERWRQTVSITGYACACPEPAAPTRAAVVLDPFGGTGTTALVADMLGRLGLSFDRSADYCRLAAWRTTDPAERARALGVPKPPPVPDGQTSLFGEAS